MVEQVNHPSHYNKPGHRECIEEMRDLFGDYDVGIWCYITAYKYLYRAGLKDGNSKQQDYDKALWYYRYADAKLIAHGSSMLKTDIKSKVAKLLNKLLKEIENE